MTGYDMYLDVKQFMEFGPPGVEVHCLHGDTIPTVDKYVCSIICVFNDICWYLFVRFVFVE